MDCQRLVKKNHEKWSFRSLLWRDPDCSALLLRRFVRRVAPRPPYATTRIVGRTGGRKGASTGFPRSRT